ncbi:MAG: M48 family metallopeptidase [Tannerella sp.]|jgi:predicted metal-dependent hydrolase|nr:M48 family metallopeptidase [Tannerella sp.]
MVEKKIKDSQLGEITLRKNIRSKRYSIRIRDGKIIATIPRNGTEQNMLTFINEQRRKLIMMLQKSPKRTLLDENTDLQTLTFRLHIFRTSRTNFYTALKDRILHIACPENTDFSNDSVQQKLQFILQESLRKEATRFIPTRLEELSRLYKFSFDKVTIRNSKTRWGSCTSKKNISISLSLMHLPIHLVDYVLLHELCHTVEMNHGEHFWQLMDKVTDGRAKAYRRELRNYRMP